MTTKMFVTGHNGDDVNEYILTHPLMSLQPNLKIVLIKSEDDDTRDVKFNQDGTKMFVLGQINMTEFVNI